MKGMLENMSEPMTELSYFECLDRVVEKSKVSIDRQTDRRMDGQMGRQTDRQIDRQTNRPTDKQTDRLTES